MISASTHPVDQLGDTLAAVTMEIMTPAMAYTPHRYAALRATARNLIVATCGGLLERADGQDLGRDVFAALAALQTAGYLQSHPGPPLAASGPTRPNAADSARPAEDTRATIRLTLPKWGLLDRFHLEHGRRAATNTSGSTAR